MSVNPYNAIFRNPSNLGSGPWLPKILSVDDKSTLQLLDSQIRNVQKDPALKKDFDRYFKSGLHDWRVGAFFTVAFAVSAIAFPIIGILGTIIAGFSSFCIREQSIVAHNIIEMSDSTSTLGKKILSDITIGDYLDTIYEGTCLIKLLSKDNIENSLKETTNPKIGIDSDISSIRV